MSDQRTANEAAFVPVRTDSPMHRDLPARPQRIMIAEDEHLVATELVLMLADLKYTVLGPASDGMAALQLAHRLLPDLILMDIRMPKKDGLAAAEQLWRELAIPTVILSAYTDPEYVEQARRGGVFGYLVKPVVEGQLRAAIELGWQRYGDQMSAHAEAAELRRRLEERRLVEQAKWKLVSERSMNEPDALKLLQRIARDGRMPLARVATSFLESGKLPGE